MFLAMKRMKVKMNYLTPAAEVMVVRVEKGFQVSGSGADNTSFNGTDPVLYSGNTYDID